MRSLKSVYATSLAVVLAGAMTVCGAVPAFAAPPDDNGGDSYLGIGPRDINSNRVAALKLKDDSGVEVVDMDHDAPAARAGVKIGDVLLTFNGQKIESAEQLKRLIHETPAGRTVQLGISRNGQPVSLAVVLGSRRRMIADFPRGPRVGPPGNGFFDNPPDIHMNILQASSKSGLLVENLTPQLGEFLGVRNGNGVLVRSVEKGSPADAAGLHAGDVIVRIDKENIGDMGDWHRLTHRRSGKTALGVVRDKREQTVNIEFTAGRDESSLDMPVIDPEQIKLQIAELRPQIDEALSQAHSTLDTFDSKEIEDAMVKARDQMALLDTDEIENAMKQAREAMAAHSDEINQAMQLSQEEMQKALKSLDKLKDCK